MSMEALVSKFRDCASHAKKHLSEKDASKAIDMAVRLEELSDVTPIIRLLS